MGVDVAGNTKTDPRCRGHPSRREIGIHSRFLLLVLRYSAYCLQMRSPIKICPLIPGNLDNYQQVLYSFSFCSVRWLGVDFSIMLYIPKRALISPEAEKSATFDGSCKLIILRLAHKSTWIQFYSKFHEEHFHFPFENSFGVPRKTNFEGDSASQKGTHSISGVWLPTCCS